MAYSKQTWNDNASGGTPITAARLNHIEDGIDNAHTAAASASTAAANAAKTATNHNDYIVAQGTSGIWYYQKFNSGRAVCYGLKSYTFSKTGNYWFADNALPFTFYKASGSTSQFIPMAISSAANLNTPYCPAEASKTSVTKISTAAVNVINTNAADVYYCVEGRWK